MSEPDYPWPSYIVGPKEHLYALGVISLNFNLYEYSLIVFLEQHFSKDVAAFLSDKLNNVERSQLIRLVMNKDIYPSVIDEVEYILRHFSICADNRHTLLHSRPNPLLNVFGQQQTLALEKFKRGEPEKILAFRLDIGELRRTADEMHAGFAFMIDLWRYFFDREHYATLMAEAQIANGAFAVPDSVHPTLPQRPPEPRKISPHQPGEDE
jgi:hypothetical protein